MSIYLSATAIKDYLVCPKRIYYRTNFPELAETNEDMDVGTLVHECLEKYWDNKNKAVEFITQKSLENNVTKESFNKSILSIENFFNGSIGTILSKGDLVEHKFKIPLAENAFLVGKIDRITETGIVIDWKTGVRTPKSINKDPQFLCYYFAYKNIYKKNPISVLYVSLSEDKIVSLNLKEDVYHQLFFQLIPNIISKIKRNDFPPVGLFNNSCYRCNFNKTCSKDMEIDTKG